MSKEDLERIVNLDESNPSYFLGPHLIPSYSGQALSIRAYLPRAAKVWLEVKDSPKKEFVNTDSRGFWEIILPTAKAPEYKISFEDRTGYIESREDPYSFEPQLGELDLYLFGEGTHRKIYEKLGSHVMTLNGIPGVHFAVWAPNAKSVSLVGDFNHWNVGENLMASRGASGIWEIFIPRTKENEVYKFAIKPNGSGKILLKTDPYAFRTELRPRTAAIVAKLEFTWSDQDWMDSQRAKFNPPKAPISIYEVHLGSWRKKKDGSFLNYREIADELVPYAKEMGFTHVELLPVMEHPFDDSWGYQVVNYYAPTSRFGTPEDFMYFVDKCHRAGIGVILDWVPAHFPKDEYGLAMFDGSHLYEHEDPRRGVHPDWGTLIFNYSRKEVRSFLISNALFWLDKYHADGLRLDAVASMLYLDYSRKVGEWLPNKYGGRENIEALEFLRETNDQMHALFPHTIAIAEESTAWPGVTHSTKKGGLGFDMKWNMGWMHDTLDYFETDPIFRKHHQRNLTFSLLYAFSENFVLVVSHDEVVYGKKSLLSKMPGDEWRKFANLRLFLGFMFSHPGKKLLFMGSEFGQKNEWNFRTELDWQEKDLPMNSKLVLYVKDLNRIFKTLPEFHEIDFSFEGFEWIDFQDADQSVISFIRKSKDNMRFSIIVCNMTPVPRTNYRIGVPGLGYYREILNSDAKDYGGSGVGNMGGTYTDTIPWHDRPFSINLTLPPLGIVVLESRSLEKSIDTHLMS